MMIEWYDIYGTIEYDDQLRCSPSMWALEGRRHENFPTFDEIRSQKASFDRIQVQTAKTIAIVCVFQSLVW